MLFPNLKECLSLATKITGGNHLETFLVITGIFLLLLGFAGCVLPVIPGPAVAYGGLFVLQFLPEPAFSNSFMFQWAAIVFFITALDYAAPVYGARYFGGGRWGVNGSLAGMIIGFLAGGPFGMIAGAFAGAFIGELIAGKEGAIALRAATGTFIGFLAGMLMKIVVVIIMTFHFVNSFV